MFELVRRAHTVWMCCESVGECLCLCVQPHLCERDRHTILRSFWDHLWPQQQEQCDFNYPKGSQPLLTGTKWFLVTCFWLALWSHRSTSLRLMRKLTCAETITLLHPRQEKALHEQWLWKGLWLSGKTSACHTEGPQFPWHLKWKDSGRRLCERPLSVPLENCC